ncbi:MAG: type II toxin-antitoxin system antitoxin SocA domain-containing protein [Candidatus Falkowbacteria bacterium]
MLTKEKLGRKIKELRESLNLNQADLAKKVGLSRVAISQIESGQRGLEALELGKIAKIFSIDMDYLLREEGPVKIKRPASKGKFKFDSNKLKNLILYILEKCGGKPNVGETVLYKLLYFADFNNFEISGKPITGMNYVHLQYGPVPSANEYCPVVQEMAEKKELKIIIQQYYGMPQKRYIALVNSDINIFNLREIKLIDAVIANLSDKTAAQIENYVHEDAPWKLTEEKQIINYKFVFERSVPYAHFDYEKMWQDAAAEDTIKELGPMSEEEANYYKNL